MDMGFVIVIKDVGHKSKLHGLFSEYFIASVILPESCSVNRLFIKMLVNLLLHNLIICSRFILFCYCMFICFLFVVEYSESISLLQCISSFLSNVPAIMVVLNVFH